MFVSRPAQGAGSGARFIEDDLPYVHAAIAAALASGALLLTGGDNAAKDDTPRVAAHENEDGVCGQGATST